MCISCGINTSNNFIEHVPYCQFAKPTLSQLGLCLQEKDARLILFCSYLQRFHCLFLEKRPKVETSHVGWKTRGNRGYITSLRHSLEGV